MDKLDNFGSSKEVKNYFVKFQTVSDTQVKYKHCYCLFPFEWDLPNSEFAVLVQWLAVLIKL